MIHSVDMSVLVHISTRVARCDFCGQSGQECYQSPNGDHDQVLADFDICRRCVVALATSLGMMKPHMGGHGFPSCGKNVFGRSSGGPCPLIKDHEGECRNPVAGQN